MDKLDKSIYEEIQNRRESKEQYDTLFNRLFGIELSETEARKELRGIENYLSHKKENGVDVEDSEFDMKLIEIQKETFKLRDQKREMSNLIRQNSRFEYFKEEIIRAVKETNKISPIEIKSKPPIRMADNEALCLWSDWHYSIFCDNYWNKYDTNIFEQRLNTLLEQTIENAKMHGVNIIHVMALGDLLSGILHTSVRVSSMEDIIAQTKQVSDFIAKALITLAEHFEEVNFYSVIGNHGRVTPNKHDAMEAENFEHLIPWYLSARLENISNINIIENEKDKTVIIANVKGKTIYGVHGDMDKIGNAVQNLSLMFKEIPYMICMGHLHHHQEDVVQDVKLVMSGSLVGTDEYAKNIRKVGSPSQAMVIFDERGKKCVYEIVV